MVDPQVLDHETLGVPAETLTEALNHADELARQVLQEGRPLKTLSKHELHVLVLTGSVKVMADEVRDARKKYKELIVQVGFEAGGAGAPANATLAKAKQLPAAWRKLEEGARVIAKDAEPDSNAAGYWRGFCIAIDGCSGDLERTLK
jgi:hypothetical protein